MKSKLEYFIDEHREEFDSQIPDIKIWHKIEKEHSGSTIKFIDRLSLRQIAASIILMISAVSMMVFFETRGIKTSGSTSTQVNNQNTIDDQDNLYQNDIHRMTQMIEIKQTELKEIKKIDPSLYKNFTGTLEQLNKFYNNLEQELKKNPNKEQLLEAMVQNLKLQQELLNQQLSIFQKLKKSKSETHIKNI